MFIQIEGTKDEKKVERMDMRSKIFAGIYVIISSISVLVMLTTSFELFNSKYLPSFILAQKYAFPLIIAAMAIMYITFFEPERLIEKRTILIMRTILVLTFLIFTFYLTTINLKITSNVTISIYLLQWFALLTMCVRFFLVYKEKAAQ